MNDLDEVISDLRQQIVDLKEQIARSYIPQDVAMEMSQMLVEAGMNVPGLPNTAWGMTFAICVEVRRLRKRLGLDPNVSTVRSTAPSLEDL